MCLILNGQNTMPIIADTDIEVYKTCGSSFLWDRIFVPGFRFYMYFRDRSSRHVKIMLEPMSGKYFKDIDGKSLFFEINKGYHAYTEKMIHLEDHLKLKCYYVFLIPKGTIYFDNDYEICAERLIYKGKQKLCV